MTQKEQFITDMKSFSDRDMFNIPSVLVRSKLFAELHTTGLDEDTASMIVSLVDINVSKEFIHDKDLFDKTIHYFTRGILNLKHAYDDIYPNLFYEVMAREKMRIDYK